MKQINDYLKFYIGCEVKIDFREKTETLVGIGHNDGKTFTDLIAHCQDDFSATIYPISSIKLLLRPLSRITRKEMLKCVELGGLYYDGKTVEQFTATWQCFGSEVTRYLLSRGIDLFGLITAGLAIDKSLQPTQ